MFGVNGSNGHRLDELFGVNGSNGHRLNELFGVNGSNGHRLDELFGVNGSNGHRLDELFGVNGSNGHRLDELSRRNVYGAFTSMLLRLLRGDAIRRAGYVFGARLLAQGTVEADRFRRLVSARVV